MFKPPRIGPENMFLHPPPFHQHHKNILTPKKGLKIISGYPPVSNIKLSNGGNPIGHSKHSKW